MNAGAARHVRHLVRRFFGSLPPGGPRPDDDAWARSHLLPGELDLWGEMRGPDRRHAVAVARRVDAAIDDAAVGVNERAVLAAALLHDVGKLEAGLGPIGRVAATLTAGMLGHRRVSTWSNRRGWAGRFGRYVLHPDLGGLLLAGAGSDTLTMAWAMEHHRPPAEWTVPAEVGSILKTADDD
ncbi:MAG: hypothetical protein ACRD0A_18810 [Acidimicrobiales bacterium]